MDKVDPAAPDGQAAAGPGLRVFSETADPDAYVPREATEQALRGLEAALRRRALCVALSGPPGLGKSLLLRVLERRIVGLGRTLYLPYASLPIRDLFAWVLGLLDQPAAADPARRVLELAATDPGAPGGLILLVDDANSMPLETARALGERVREAGGTLRLALASPDDARLSRVFAALGLEIHEERYDRSLTSDETRHYVTERLRHSDAGPTLWRALDASHVRRLHALSGGNPRRLHVLAAELVRGDPGRHVLAKIEPEWSALLDAPDDPSAEEAHLEADSFEGPAGPWDRGREPDEPHGGAPEPPPAGPRAPDPGPGAPGAPPRGEVPPAVRRRLRMRRRQRR